MMPDLPWDADAWRRQLAAAPDDAGRWQVFHNAANELAALVARGLDKACAVDALHHMATAYGLDDEQSQAIMAEAFGRQAEQPKTNGNGKHAPTCTIRPTQYIAPDVATIPKRAWLYGSHYIRGCVTATVAPGGFGKTTLALYEALIMVQSGIRVWFVSGEDDRIELDRRIAAHCQEHPIDDASPFDWRACFANLFVDDKMSFPFKIAKQEKFGCQFDQQQLAAFEQAIIANRIDMIFLDPFVSFHLLSENDTGAMDLLIKRLGEICHRQQCCIELCHHVRKPNMMQTEITVYDARGAAAIVNAVRSCRVLNHMTTGEAEQARIEPDERKFFVRIDSGKSNMTPPEAARWTKLVSVQIANGDRVQALRGWEFKAVQATAADREWIKTIMSNGRSYRADSRSPDWLGLELAEHFDRDVKNRSDITWINKTLNDWVKLGILDKIERPDEDRKMRKFFVLKE